MSRHFYWLDLIRFSAALIVVTAHARAISFVEYGGLVDSEKTLLITVFYAVTRIANEAVVVFFVLSGFLVGGRALERIIQGKFRPSDFLIDRFVRIMLPLIPALFFTAIIRLVIDGDFDIIVLVANILSLQGVFFPVFGENGPLWSLSYEVWFYVLAYAVGIIVIKKTFDMTAITLFVIVTAIFTYLNSVYLFCWLIGALIYHRSPDRFSLVVLLCSIFLSIYSVVAIQIGSESVSISIKNIDIYLLGVDVSRILLSLSMAIAMQQVLFLKPTNKISISADKIGTIMAASSYTLYLVHLPMLHLLSYLGVERADKVNFYTISVYLFTICVCLVVSWLLYLLFEKHTIVVRQYIKNACYLKFGTEK